MSTNKTQNYQLHAWAAEDEGLLGELNANFTQLDTALKAEESARKSAVTAEANARTAGLAQKAEVVIGSYVGDDTDSKKIILGFRPRTVHLESISGARSNGSTNFYGGLMPPSYYTNTGFSIPRSMSSSSNTYYYVAYR